MKPGDGDRSVVFTVFTATFNRAHTLRRAYDGLRSQTYRDFEWIVVDDGSTDHTRRLVELWRAEASFPIRYIHQRNQGKHVAFNRAVAAARGELFISLDSDDSCVPTALERLKWHWDRIPSDARSGFTGVTGLCVDQLGRLVGTRFPKDVLDSDSNEIRYRYGVTSEKWGFHVLDHLRRHPFPEIPGAFAPEGLVWYALARKYKTRFVNEVVRVYWVAHGEGAQISRGRPTAATAGALALLHRSILDEDLRWFPFAPVSFLHSALNYSRFSFGSGAGIRLQRNQLGLPAQALWLVAMPLGFAASLWDAWRRRRPAADVAARRAPALPAVERAGGRP